MQLLRCVSDTEYNSKRAYLSTMYYCYIYTYTYVEVYTPIAYTRCALRQPLHLWPLRYYMHMTDSVSPLFANLFVVLSLFCFLCALASFVFLLVLLPFIWTMPTVWPTHYTRCPRYICKYRICPYLLYISPIDTSRFIHLY